MLGRRMLCSCRTARDLEQVILLISKPVILLTIQAAPLRYVEFKCPA